MTAEEKRSKRILKNRQRAQRNAMDSPRHPGNLKKSTGAVDYGEPNENQGPQKTRKARKRIRRISEGEFDTINWDDIDGRHYRCKEVKRIVEKLMKEASIDSYAKHILAERCAFIIALIRNAETLALKGEKFDRTEYVSLVGKLQAILATLGIENKEAKKVGLAAHLEKRANGELPTNGKKKRGRPKGTGSKVYNYVDRTGKTVV